MGYILFYDSFNPESIFKSMLSIRKNDTVILAGGVSAKVIDIITTEIINVYKIKKLTG